jgi:methyl-accepting chemotaxis protein
MTEIQSDEGQKRVMLWEIHGISQEDCAAVVEQHIDNTRKLNNAEDKVRMARDIVKLLKSADENTADGSELSLRTLDQLDRVESLLKSAKKKIDKYSNEQKIRDIEKWKEGGAK